MSLVLDPADSDWLVLDPLESDWLVLIVQAPVTALPVAAQIGAPVVAALLASPVAAVQISVAAVACQVALEPDYSRTRRTITVTAPTTFHVPQPVLPGTSFPIRARILNTETGSPLVQDDVSSISLSVFYEDDPNTILATDTPNVSDVIFDTLQTVGWNDDQYPSGYNFRYVVPATHAVFAGKVVIWAFSLSLAGGTTVKLRVAVPVRE